MTRSLGLALVLLMLMARPAGAQESRFASDLRREREHIAGNCSELRKIPSCAVTLATDYPFHIALGSLAPGNGFGFGLAFVERYTPSESWKISWSADGVATPSGAWRGGAYLKVIHTPDRPVVVVRPGESRGTSAVRIQEHPVFNAYWQTISIREQSFFGVGPSSIESGQSIFGERQTIVGSTALWPIPVPDAIAGLRPSLVGGLNARFVRIRAGTDGPAPSIEQLYDDLGAPGLAHQPTFVQLEEGIRLKPSLANGWLRLNYLASFQQFFAEQAARSSFQRWTVDLKHEIPLYRTVASAGPIDTNGPNECFTAIGSDACPPLTYSRNRGGAIGVRVLTTSSSPYSGSRVPFYFQPTVGGSDINGQRLLASFHDARFRGPHAIVFQQSLEHSIWGPLGAYILAEQGQVAERRRELNLDGFSHSVSVGLTVRAGGLPMMNFSFAWGGEGSHVIATMDTSLLGGAGRPPLY